MNNRAMSMSVSHGAAAGKLHNLSQEHRANLVNVDDERTHLNEVLVAEDLADAYVALFGDAVASYNAGQARADRRIEDYLEKIQASKQEKPVYEMVIQIGNRSTNSAESEANRLGSSQIYRDFLERFEREFPQLHVHQAVIHQDEATPHLHVAYVPYSTGNKRGLETKNSLSGAYKQMGFEDVRQANERMQELLADAARDHGIERLDMGCGRARLSVRDYKAMVRQIENEEDYPYRDNPALKALVIEQQEALENMGDIIDQMNATIESFTQHKPSVMNLASWKDAYNQWERDQRRLKDRIDVARSAVSRFKAVVDAIPQWWRQNIMNPIRDSLLGARAAFDKQRQEIRGQVLTSCSVDPARKLSPKEDMERAVGHISAGGGQASRGRHRAR